VKTVYMHTFFVLQPVKTLHVSAVSFQASSLKYELIIFFVKEKHAKWDKKNLTELNQIKKLIENTK
jgi:hypothetical protein